MGNEFDLKKYDVVIIGGGISGSSLLYVLTKYTDIKSIALIEKYSKVAQVNSNTNSNSQTLHFGDIETNYNLEKAKKVKAAANFVKNYVEKYDKEKKCFTIYSKMVLAIGKEEIVELEKRYEEFKKLFPKLKLIDKKEIEKIEPNVLKGRNPKEEVLALHSPEGYTIDYQMLSESFLERAKKSKVNKKIDIFFDTKVIEIKKASGGYKIITDNGDFQAEYVDVNSGAHSLLFARSMGYGCDFALLNIAGSFFSANNALNGKVYRVQIKKLPFAAIHGDPEVHDKSMTRFGPTAKAIFMLERYNYKTVFEYFKTAGINFRANNVLMGIIFDYTMLRYLIKNFFYDLPVIGKILFIKEVRNIVPSMKLRDLKFARGYGGARPQIINIPKKKLEFGEAKIRGDNIIFNVTPSPGASTCLKNAQDDAKIITKTLHNHFNNKKFEEDH